MKGISIRCPAKLNLFLSVGPPDERRYHPLRTVFQAIELSDTLEIDFDSEVGFVCDDSAVPADNTVTKAARLLSEIVSLPPMRVTLHKRIPAESGMGGGSSDAAGFLRVAKRLAPGRLPDAELNGIAQAIGADVPFFLVGGRARAEGYGEQLIPLPDQPSEWLVVTRPNIGCPTPEAFRQLDQKSYVWREFTDEDILYNDFERVAPCESLDLIERLVALGARDAALCGSGSAVFGRFRSQSDAESAHRQLVDEATPHAWVTRTLTRRESLEIK